MQLATIGYEGSSIDDFVATLCAAGITQILDVREVAQSRRPGFSKNALRSALEAAGIAYHHIKQLGDPKPGREAARAGDMSLFRAIFSGHMELPASRIALAEAVELANERQSALMCFERDPKNCHRAIVAEQMTAVSPFRVVHIGVNPPNRSKVAKSARTATGLIGAC